jgi:hypothetical protein
MVEKIWMKEVLGGKFGILESPRDLFAKLLGLWWTGVVI